MAPKAKPSAKSAAKAAPKAGTPAKAEAPPPAPAPSDETLPVYEAEARLRELDDEIWEELAGLTEPSDSVAKTFQAVLALLGDPEPGNWATAKAAAADPPELFRELAALGPWGASNVQLETANSHLAEANLGNLRAPSASAEATPAKAGAKAKQAPKAKAKAPAAAKTPDPGAPAAFALGQLVRALSAERDQKPDEFSNDLTPVPFLQLHLRLQQALFTGRAACVICESPAAYDAAVMFSELGGAVLCDLGALQSRVGLSKDLTLDAAQAELGKVVKRALQNGNKCVLLVGAAPPNVHRYCHPKLAPAELFQVAKTEDVKTAMGLGDIKEGFQIVVLVQMSKAASQKHLKSLIPGFLEDVATICLDDFTLPKQDALDAIAGEAPAAGSARRAVKAKPCLRAALRLLASLPEERPKPASNTTETGPAVEEICDGSPMLNKHEFEFNYTFGEDWEQQWRRGPAENDEQGKPIRKNLINIQIVKYPPDPKVAKPCLQLTAGAPNAPCTGIWTCFEPLCRPTEIEFEFTMQGKVDLPNACVVLTQRPFEGALPDTKVGIQFTVRGGMQLSGGSGNLVRISNDGKIQNDKWNKVLLKIDWNEKVIVGQVDTRGKGYAPAIQTVPFRDQECEGIGYLYIYNTDMQATCWFSWIRVKQDPAAVEMDKEALDARAEMAARLKQKQYDQAVAADMEVGMKMGAIKSTAQHGMNLAQEQAANSSSHAGASMGR